MGIFGLDLGESGLIIRDSTPFHHLSMGIEVVFPEIFAQCGLLFATFLLDILYFSIGNYPHLIKFHAFPL